MSENKMPWFKFFPNDWLSDKNLKRCSHAAKGVWMDMLCLMFDCDERGVLATAGIAWSDDDVACAIGGDKSDTLLRIMELLDKGVAKRNANGAILSARVVRDERLRVARSRSGALGGKSTYESGLLKQNSKQVSKQSCSKPPSKHSSNTLTSDICLLSSVSQEQEEGCGEREEILFCDIEPVSGGYLQEFAQGKQYAAEREVIDRICKTYPVGSLPEAKALLWGCYRCRESLKITLADVEQGIAGKAAYNEALGHNPMSVVSAVKARIWETDWIAELAKAKKLKKSGNGQTAPAAVERVPDQSATERYLQRQRQHAVDSEVDYIGDIAGDIAKKLKRGV